MVWACLPPAQGDLERPRANVDDSGVQEAQWHVPLCFIVVCFCFVSETEQRQRNVGLEKWISKVITRKKEARLACEVDRQILWGLCFPQQGTELLLSAWELSGWSVWEGSDRELLKRLCPYSAKPILRLPCKLQLGGPSPSQGLSLISHIIFYGKSSAAWKPGAQWLYLLSAQQDHQLLEDKAKSHVNCAFFVVLARRTANSEDVGVIEKTLLCPSCSRLIWWILSFIISAFPMMCGDPQGLSSRGSCCG